MLVLFCERGQYIARYICNYYGSECFNFITGDFNKSLLSNLLLVYNFTDRESSQPE